MKETGEGLLLPMIATFIIFAIAILAAAFSAVDGLIIARIVGSIALCAVTGYAVHETGSPWCLWAMIFLGTIWRQ